MPESSPRGPFAVFRAFRVEFRGWFLRAVGVAALQGTGAVFELASIAAITALGAAIVAGGGDVPVELPLGITLSRRELGLATLVGVSVRGIVELLAVFLHAVASERFDCSLRSGLLDAFVRAEWSTQSMEDPSEFANTCLTFITSATSAYQQVMQAMASLASFGIMLLGSLVIGGLWVFAIFGAAVILAIALRPLNSFAHRTGVASRDATRRFSRALWDTVANAVEIRVFNITDALRAANGYVSAEAARAGARRLVATNALSSIYTSAVYLTTTAGLVALVVFEVKHPATYAAIVLLLYRGLDYARGYQSLYQQLVAVLPALEALQETRNRLDLARVGSEGTEVAEVIEGIAFDNVSYAYPDGKDALRGVSFELGRGETLGVIGASGSGKSTLVQLLLRLRVPTGGRVVVNGRNLAEVAPGSWFGRVVLVPQSPQMFSGTVRENVRVFRASVSDDDVTRALSDAHVLEEILALPDGLDTDLSTNRLSGGQRQRMAIARALAGRPELIVLDEPTSALDLLSEEAIRITLESLRGRVTMVIVAHRLSTLRICDRIMVLGDGAIDAIGDREQLESDSTFYAEAVRLATAT